MRIDWEQIVAIRKETAAGVSPTDLCRQHGAEANTFYRWKVKPGDPGVSEVRRLKAHEDENSRLKELMADQSLDTTTGGSGLLSIGSR